LQNNKLEGTLPNDIQTYSSLTHLDLSGNALTGLRPDARLANMKQLTSLYLGGTNFIKGPFPIELTTLTDLRELSLKQSNLNGTLPEAIARLSNLLLLDLEGNDIEGEIPSTMGNLTKLGFLLLNRNRLTGTVPLTLDKLNRVGTSYCIVLLLAFMTPLL
jgi:Leucine-rich repeat (LRR) protein